MSMYTSSPNRKLEEDLEEIRNNERFPITNLLKLMRQRIRTDTIDKESVCENINVLRGRSGKEYLMLLDILMHRAKATNWAGKLIKSEECAIHHIFPREVLREDGYEDERMINCLANLTIIDPGINSEIGDQLPSNYLPIYLKDEKVLDNHFIPKDRNLWKLENYERFLAVRIKLIWKEVKNLLEELS